MSSIELLLRLEVLGEPEANQGSQHPDLETAAALQFMATMEAAGYRFGTGELVIEGEPHVTFSPVSVTGIPGTGNVGTGPAAVGKMIPADVIEATHLFQGGGPGAQ